MTFPISEELHRQIRVQAAKEGLSVASWVRKTLGEASRPVSLSALYD